MHRLRKRVISQPMLFTDDMREKMRMAIIEGGYYPVIIKNIGVEPKPEENLFTKDWND